MYYLHKATSAVRCVKPNASQREATLRDYFGFPTVYRRIYSREFLTLSNQTSRYISKCIRMSLCLQESEQGKCNRECHSHKAQPSRGTKERRGTNLFLFSLWCLGKAVLRDNTNATYEITDAENKEELQQRNRLGMVSRKPGGRGRGVGWSGNA